MSKTTDAIVTALTGKTTGLTIAQIREATHDLKTPSTLARMVKTGAVKKHKGDTPRTSRYTLNPEQLADTPSRKKKAGKKKTRRAPPSAAPRPRAHPLPRPNDRSSPPSPPTRSSCWWIVARIPACASSRPRTRRPSRSSCCPTSPRRGPHMNAPTATVNLGPAFEYLPLKALVPSASPVQALRRQSFTDASLDQLGATFGDGRGVIEPLIVRLDRSNNVVDPAHRRYEIIAGERRYLAAERVGLATVPCIIRDLDDAHALELQMIENLQRDAYSALEEAAGFKELLRLKSTPDLPHPTAATPRTDALRDRLNEIVGRRGSNEASDCQQALYFARTLERENAELRHDIERHLGIISQNLAEITELRRQLAALAPSATREPQPLSRERIDAICNIILCDEPNWPSKAWGREIAALRDMALASLVRVEAAHTISGVFGNPPEVATRLDAWSKDDRLGDGMLLREAAAMLRSLYGDSQP